jgi:hypothetical protein
MREGYDTMSISSALHDDDAKAAFLVHASLLPLRDRNRSQYLTRSSKGLREAVYGHTHVPPPPRRRL